MIDRATLGRLREALAANGYKDTPSGAQALPGAFYPHHGPSWLARLVEANPYHDERGRFSTKEDAAGTSAFPSGKRVDAWSRRAAAFDAEMVEKGFGVEREMDEVAGEVAHWRPNAGDAADLPDSTQKENAYSMARGALYELVNGSAGVVLRSGGRVAGVLAMRRMRERISMPYDEENAFGGGAGKRKLPVRGYDVYQNDGHIRREVDALHVDYAAASPFPEGKGAGRRMFAEVCRRAAREGRYVTLEALTTAASYYKSIGMTQYTRGGGGELPRFYFTPGQANRFAATVLHGAKAKAPGGGFYEQPSFADREAVKRRERRGRLRPEDWHQGRLTEAERRSSALYAIDEEAPEWVRQYVLGAGEDREPLVESLRRLLEFDPGQPRWPAGSPEGGQWAPMDAIAGAPAFVLDGKGGVELPKNKDGSVNSNAAKAAAMFDFKAVTARATRDVEAAMAGRVKGISAEQAGRMSRWYSTMHRGLQVLSGKYGVSVEQSCGIAAALSQQNAWPSNITQTRQLLSVMRENKKVVLTEEMATDLLEATTAAYKLQLKGRKAGSPPPDPPVDLHDFRGENWVGKTIQARSLTPDLLVRVHPDFPHGSFGYTAAEKAVAIWNGKDPRKTLGGHKVRSFFNNLLRPDLDREVTIDTHMIRYLFNDPTIQGSDRRADRIFGGKNAYAYASAIIRETARRTKLKPHEVQALLWNVWKEGHSERGKVGGRAKRGGWWAEDPRYEYETHGVDHHQEAGTGGRRLRRAGRPDRPALGRPRAGGSHRRGLGAVSPEVSPVGLPTGPSRPGTRRLVEYNPYHDEAGRFTTAEDNSTGSPAPSSMSAAIAAAAPSRGRGRMVVTDDVELAAAARVREAARRLLRVLDEHEGCCP